MEGYKTYIQQIKYNGTGYSYGTLVDILSSFDVICKDFPYKKNPETKDFPTRDWAGTDGLDVYIPEGNLPIKSYDLEATFMYKGTHANMRSKINDFLDFICGRKKGANGDTIQSGRLAIYNEYMQMGRKDVAVKSVNNEVFFDNGDDPDAVATFKVKFSVYDPTTDVTINTSGLTPTLQWT